MYNESAIKWSRPQLRVWNSQDQYCNSFCVKQRFQNSLMGKIELSWIYQMLASMQASILTLFLSSFCHCLFQHSRLRCLQSRLSVIAFLKQPSIGARKRSEEDPSCLFCTFYFYIYCIFSMSCIPNRKLFWTHAFKPVFKNKWQTCLTYLFEDTLRRFSEAWQRFDMTTNIISKS